MKLEIYSIFDEAAKAFNTPFFMANKAMALRAFTDLANDSQSSINKHPGDYKLYKIGTFNDENSNIESIEIPELIAHASDAITNQE